MTQYTHNAAYIAIWGMVVAGKRVFVFVFGNRSNSEYVRMSGEAQECGYKGSVYGLYMNTADPSRAIISTDILHSWLLSHPGGPDCVAFDFDDHVLM